MLNLLKLNKKTPERRHWRRSRVFIKLSRFHKLLCCFHKLTLHKCMPAGTWHVQRAIKHDQRLTIRLKQDLFPHCCWPYFENEGNTFTKIVGAPFICQIQRIILRILLIYCIKLIFYYANLWFVCKRCSYLILQTTLNSRIKNEISLFYLETSEEKKCTLKTTPNSDFF